MRRGEAMWTPQRNDGPVHSERKEDALGHCRLFHFSNSPNEAVIIFCVEKVF